MKIYIVRHGQSTHNANQDVPHNPDPPLTELGQMQAKFTAAALKEELSLRPDALYASPQRRALQTVRPIQEALGLPAQILPDICEVGGLREHHGMSRNQILTEWPGVLPDSAITEEGWWRGGDADELEDVFYERAARAIQQLRSRHQPKNGVGISGDTIVVVTHGRFGSAFVSTLLSQAPAGYSRYPFDNCGITCIDFDDYHRVAYAPKPPDLTLESIRLLFHNHQTHIPTAHRS